MSDPGLPIPLDTWRAILGYHPWHFWQQADNTIDGLRITSACNGLVREYAWQNMDAVGRSEIRNAIRTAGNRLFEYLGYRVGTAYVEKILDYPRPYDGRMTYGRAADSTGRWLALNVKEGFIQAIGIESRTLLGTPAVTYSDADGDGVTDTAAFSVATTVTDPSELAVYFVAADRLSGEPVGEKWRIEPVTISISGGTASFVCPSWLLVRPIRYQGIASAEIGPNNTGALANVFAQTVEVHQRVCDPTGTTTATAQAMLIWETNPPWGFGWCLGCSSAPTYNPYAFDPAAEAYAIARCVIRDPRRGEIGVGEACYDATNDRFVEVNWSACKPPDRVVIRYKAGADLDEFNSQITYGGTWGQIVSRLAMAETPRRICACDQANQELYHWQFDMSRAAGANDEQYRISDSDLNNPFGTRRGAVYAWKQVQNLQLTRAFVVG